MVTPALPGKSAPTQPVTPRVHQPNLLKTMRLFPMPTGRSILPAVLLLCLMAGPSLAQTRRAAPVQRDTITVQDKKVTIEMNDGKVTVNGQAVDSDNDRLIVRVGPDGETFTVFLGEGGPFRHPFAPGARAFFWNENDAPGEMLRRFRLEAPNFDVTIPRFEMEMARPFQAPSVDLFHWNGEGPGRQRFFLRSFEDNVEIARMEREAWELARQARRAEGAEKTRLENELRTKLDQIFDQKLQLQQKRLEELEGDMQEQRSSLEERRRSREQIIQKRQRELLGEDDTYEW